MNPQINIQIMRGKASLAKMVSAWDRDDSSTSDGTVTWSFARGNWQNKFLIDPETGAITTAATLDREGWSWIRSLAVAHFLPCLSLDATGVCWATYQGRSLTYVGSVACLCFADKMTPGFYSHQLYRYLPCFLYCSWTGETGVDGHFFQHATQIREE